MNDEYQNSNLSEIDKKKNKKAVLVTGGSGFIASHLVDRLIKLGYFVINIDRLDYCSYDNTKNINNSYKFIHGNIANKELITFILNEYCVESVFHLAAQTHVDNSFYNSINFTYDNIVGTHILLECVREYKLKENTTFEKFIHMSTDEVYGEITEGGTECTENSVLKPTNPYAATKASAELIAQSYNHSFGMPIVISRGNNVYGPNQYPEKLIPRFIKLLKEDKKVTIQGDGSCVRAFLHAHDTATAFIKILEKGKIGEIYNIGCDEGMEYSVMEVAKILIKLIKKTEDYDKWISYIEDRPFNDQRYYISNKKLRDLGWDIKIKFMDGINELIK